MHYILVKQFGERTETVEVLPGREARRDQLVAAGYEWVNEPSAAAPKAEPEVRNYRRAEVERKPVDKPDPEEDEEDAA